MAKLRIEFSGSVREIDLTEDTSFGRGDESTVVFDDKQCSRRHCQIERTEGGWKLVDLESRNGTKVNGNFVNQHLLKNNDRVEVGTAFVTFLSAAADETDPGTGPPPPPRLPPPPAKPQTQPVRVPPPPAPVAYRTPAPRRPQSSSSALGAVFGAILLVAVAAGGFFLSRKDPAEVRATQLWAEAKEHILKKNYAEAVKVLRQMPTSVIESSARAQAKIDELERTLAEEQRLRDHAEQTDRYDEIRKFAVQNPDKRDELARKIDFFRKDYPTSARLKDLDALLADSGGGAGGGGGTPPIPIDRTPVTIGGGGGTTLPPVKPDDYKVIETSVGQLIAAERFGPALRALDEYIKKLSSQSPEAKKALDWRAKILDEAELFFTAKDEAARKLIKERKYAEARALYDAVVKSFGEENSLFERSLKAQDEIKRITELENPK